LQHLYNDIHKNGDYILEYANIIVFV